MLSVFSFESQDVRVVLIDGEPWWVATDVAKVLEYSQAQALVKVLDANEVGSSILDDGNKYSVINESGLYHAVFSSKNTQRL